MIFLFKEHVDVSFIIDKRDFRKWFSPEKHPDEIYYIFGKGGGMRLAKEFNTDLLGQIPLVMEVGEAAEQGLSVFSQKNKPVVMAFEKIAETIVAKTGAKK